MSWPLARSPPITRFILSNRLVVALSFCSGVYLPTPSLSRLPVLSLCNPDNHHNSLTQQDTLREVQNLREQIHRVKGTTVRHIHIRSSSLHPKVRVLIQ